MSIKITRLPSRRQYQTGKPLRATLTGVASLVGATVKLVMISTAAGAVAKINNAPCTVVDAAACIVEYDWQPTDVDTIDEFQIVFWVHYSDGTFDPVPDQNLVYLMSINPAPAHA